MLEINFKQQNSNLRSQGRLHAIRVYLFILFCFKVTGQTKYLIKESLITLDIGQWILILTSNVSLECVKYFRVTYYG